MNTRDGKQGLALIIVLGFLAVFLMLALSFALTMRTERLASEVAKESMQADILMRGALQGAMDVVDSTYRGSGNPEYFALPDSLKVLASSSADNVLLGAELDLLGGAATDWLPRRFTDHTLPDYKNAKSVADTVAEWIFVEDPVANAAGENRLIGRFGFVCLDCSADVDINIAGRLETRAGGHSVAEIQLQELPGVDDAAEINRNLQDYHWFTSFPEIRYINGTAVFSTNPVYLSSYSLFYDKGWWDTSSWIQTNNVNGFDIPININEWTNIAMRANAEAAMQSYLGAHAGASFDDFYDNLLDYIDEDHIPQNFGDSAGTELLPMINEIRIASFAIDEVDSDTTKFTVNVQIETWYPFASYTEDRFEFEDFSVSKEPGVEALHVQYIVVIDFSTGASTSYNEYNNVTAVMPAGFTPTNEFQLHDASISWEVETAPPLGKHVLLAMAPGEFNLINATLSEQVDVARPLSEVKQFNTRVNALPATKDITSVQTCDDPRLNHRNSEWDRQKWTPGDMNPQVTTIGDSGGREGTVMYVRDGPMESAAELGFLSVGSSWSTVNLFEEEGLELLDKYRAFEEGTDFPYYTNGLINFNGVSKDVLYAVFPYTNTAIDVSVESRTNIIDDASRIDDIVDAVYDRALTGNYYSASGWISPDMFGVNGSLAKVGYNNMQREAIIRNNYKMFSTTQNLLLFVIVAQAIQDNNRIGTWDVDEDVVLGESRAVALVWRDPYPGTNGVHEMFVRDFKFLDE